MEKRFYDDYLNYANGLAALYGMKLTENDQRDIISFTPYIYNVCSANCKFCSEKLVRDGSVMVCNNWVEDYAKRLNDVFVWLGDQKIFLSLSGKEPTESPLQLKTITECANRFAPIVTEKVMYTNLSGFGHHFDLLRDIVVKAGLTRIECSRHHYDEEVNQTIMCFRKGVEVRRNEVYRDIINKMADVVDFRLVCVLQKCGVGTLDEIYRYLDFAQSLGVKDVVFRELAMFDDSIENGVTTKYIEENRVEIMDLITRLNPNDFRLTDIIKGYYYFSFGYRFRNGLNVCFEMSDYEEMIAKHYGDKIYKLILYPNGKLCTDWNMKGELIIEPKKLCV